MIRWFSYFWCVFYLGDNKSVPSLAKAHLKIEVKVFVGRKLIFPPVTHTSLVHYSISFDASNCISIVVALLFPL